MRDPRMAARSQASQNPLVRGWRRLRSNRFMRKIAPGGGAKQQGGAGGAERSKNSVAGRDERTDDGIADAPCPTHNRVGDRDEGSNASFVERSGPSHQSGPNRQR
jgi:hypothetical protein